MAIRAFCAFAAASQPHRTLLRRRCRTMPAQPLPPRHQHSHACAGAPRVRALTPAAGICAARAARKIKTTPCHPIPNGIVEHFHRHLNSAIKASKNYQRSELIPVILLDIRTAVKKNLQSSSAELVYRTTLHLPCDVTDVSDILSRDTTFVIELCHRMRQLNPVPTSAHNTD
ncbi:retrovirus-related Pol polyprotein from transposon 412 [Nephila pilipes]|uniref:Retrovirus-related Pol polyprotein from transposon 412 n=1 Tax=Nephila pilipes TaxID=299642 RepID=A0A8X6MZR7_NEPPI|nr:retrovirus-related Pol polyprotein from transposon 412 [Nephila pilipes]